MTKYPVVFFVFKRPKHTYDFLVRMHEAGIKKIYVFADGPRNAEEKILTDKVRSEINRFKKDHKDITIITNYAKANIGLRENIIKGLNKVFSKESAAIIIEDDCRPSPDFFRFTQEMLEKYKDDTRIMSINGTSLGGIYKYSYDFTKYSQCWGWATWKRSWAEYDVNITTFTNQKWRDISKRLKLTRIMRWYWQNVLEVTTSHKINTWDYQWSYAHFYHNALAISPSKNLITNIGFDEVATNTKFKTSVSNIRTDVLDWPLKHPKVVLENIEISNLIERKFYNNFVAIVGIIKKKYLW